MGKHGIGTINDNGERLCHFCDENNMVIGGTEISTRWHRPRPVEPLKARWITFLSTENGEAHFKMQGPTEEQMSAVITTWGSLKLHRARRRQGRGHHFDSSKLKDDKLLDGS